MFTKLKQCLWVWQNVSLKSTAIIIIVFVFVLLRINVYGQTTVAQDEDTQASETQDTQNQDTEITRRKYNDLSEILKLIDDEKFDIAQKKIRRARLIYTGDPDLPKLENYLKEEMEEAKKQAPLQAIKEEIPNLLLTGRISEAKDRLADVRKEFPRDEYLRQLNYSIIGMIWLKNLLIVAGLVIVLSTIGVSIIYIKSKFVAACVYIFAWYLTAIPIGILLFLFVGPILIMGNELGPVRILFEQGSLATLSCCAGALGGAISASFALVTMPAKVRSNLKFSIYFFKPINGFFIAFIMFVGVMSGQFAFSSNGGDLGPQARWSLCLLAILSGFFSDAATEKLREIKQAIFGKEVTVITSIDEDSVNLQTESLAIGVEKGGSFQPPNSERSQRSRGSKKAQKQGHTEIGEVSSTDNI